MSKEFKYYVVVARLPSRNIHFQARVIVESKDAAIQYTKEKLEEYLLSFVNSMRGADPLVIPKDFWEDAEFEVSPIEHRFVVKFDYDRIDNQNPFRING